MTTSDCGRRCALLIRVGTFLLFSALWSVSVQAETYSYDANGRLRSVTTTTGDSSEYLYDALGNLLAINSIPAGQLAIFAFTPNHGPVGRTVTITGQGFSTTPANNAVQFHGITATVSSSTATQLIVTVPVGATTGPLSLTVAGVSTSSFDDFVVTSGAGSLPPIITSFTPAVADANSFVTVTGSHFAQTADLVQAGVLATIPYTSYVTPPSDTLVVFPVLPQTTTGVVTVISAFGAAQSSQRLIVVPTTIGATNVISSTSITVDSTPQSLNINAAGKYGAAVFTGTAGQWLSLQFASFSATPASAAVAATVYDPTNTMIFSSLISSGTLSAHLPKLMQTGSYIIVLSPAAGATAQFTIGVESNPTFSQATPLTVATTSTAQSKRFFFAATQGENLGLGVSNLVVTGNAYNDVNLQFYNPDGSSWQNAWSYVTNGGGDYNLRNAIATGGYAVIARPDAGGGTFSFTTTLSDDVVVPLSANTLTSVAVTHIGQNAWMTFSGTAGATMALQINAISTTPANRNVVMNVYKPDGTQLATSTASTDTMFNLATLPATGTYKVYVDPSYGATASLSALLIPSGSAAVTAGGSTGSVSTTVNGQYAYFSFTATQGENLGLGISNLVVTGNSYNDVSLQIFNPDGSSWQQAWCYVVNGGCDFNLRNAPTTGTYSVVARPDAGGGTFSFTTTLSDDAIVPLTANTAASVSLPRIGQNGWLTFSGTAGATMALQITGITTTPTNRNVQMTVYKPDGTPFTTGGATANTMFNLPTLPATGTYQVYVDPAYGATMNLSALLIPSASAAVTAGGSAMTVSTATSGQYTYFSFTATQGENLGLGISNLVVTGNSYNDVSLQIFNPDGSSSQQAWCYVANGGCDFNLRNAPTTGTYSVIVRPDTGGGTFSFTATLSDDVVVPLTANTAASVSASRIGQNAWMTFSGTAGATMALQLSGVSTTPANRNLVMTVYKPDGTQLLAGVVTLGTLFNLATLPSTGTYKVYVDPAYGATASLSALLIPSGSAAVTVGGSAGTVSTTVSGQYAYFSFAATQGENIGLGISNLVVTGNAYNDVYVTVYKPDGSVWQQGWCAISSGGCDYNLSNAPTTGTYSVVTRPDAGGGTFSFTATLSDDVVLPLTANTSATLTLAQTGQNGWMSFSGTTGATMSLQITGISTTPASRNVLMTIYKPDGTQFMTTSTSTSYTFSSTSLPATGTYKVYVDPQYGATATLSALKSP